MNRLQIFNHEGKIYFVNKFLSLKQKEVRGGLEL